MKITNIKNEIEDTNKDHTDIKRIREYCDVLYTWIDTRKKQIGSLKITNYKNLFNMK